MFSCLGRKEEVLAEVVYLLRPLNLAVGYGGRQEIARAAIRRPPTEKTSSMTDLTLALA